MGRQPVVDKRMFDCAKMLFENGAPNTEVIRYLKLSAKTVQRIKASEDFEDYKRLLAAMALEHKQKYAAKKNEVPQINVPASESIPTKEPPQVQVIEHRQKVEVVATHYMMEELKRQTELLTLIGNKLTAIMEDLGCLK